MCIFDKREAWSCMLILQADSGTSEINIFLVLQKLTPDMEDDRYIWKKQGKPKCPVIAISPNLLSERDRKHGFEISSIMDFQQKAECWQDVGASNDTIWSLIIWGLVGGIELFVNFFIFLLLLAVFFFFFFFKFSFLFFFFFSCPLEWPGKGGGRRTQHSQDTSQFI